MFFQLCRIKQSTTQYRALKINGALLFSILFIGFLFSSVAIGQVSLLFSKAFDPNVIAPENVSTLVFTIDNSAGGSVATDISFVDNLPAGLLVATPSNQLTDCAAGIITAPFGGASIGFSSGLVEAGASCTIAIDIVSTTDVSGNLINITDNLTSSEGDSGAAVAEIFIDSSLISFTKAFMPAIIPVETISTLTFTLNNNVADAIANISFADTLPDGVVLAAIPNVSTDCPGGAITAVAGGTIIGFNTSDFLSGFTRCFVSVDVTSDTAGIFINTSSDLLSELGSNGRTTAQLEVVPLPVFAKEFVPDTIDVGASSTLAFHVDNTLSALDATALSFTDNLPAGVVVADQPNANTTCGGGILTADPDTGVIVYVDGTVSAVAACVVSVDVTAAIPGIQVNVTNDLISSLGNSGSATAVITVTAITEVPTLSLAGLCLLMLLLLVVYRLTVSRI